MFFGFLLSFIVFGGLAYFISKVALASGFDKENRAIAGLFYFLAPLLALCILSLVVVGAYSMMGFSVSAMAEIIVQKANFQSSGFLVVLGSILTAIFALTAVAAGPATAFTASQVSTVVAIIVLVVKPERSFCEKWLPLAAGLTYGFCMWPFAALLTFGL